MITIKMAPELVVPKGTKPLTMKDLVAPSWCLTGTGSYLAIDPARVAKSAERLDQLEDFVAHVAKMRNDPKSRKGKRWDILSDVLNDLGSEARDLKRARNR